MSLRPALEREAVEWQYTHGVLEVTTIYPDEWEHDLALSARPGVDRAPPAPQRFAATSRMLVSNEKQGVSMSVDRVHQQAFGWQRAENTLIAVGIVIAVIVWGQAWWLLLAVFLVFDLSMLGYLVDQRVGALCYNLVHNYAAPAVLVVGWAALQLGDIDADWLVLVAACWGFHVAVDRALGYGLKLGPFAHTHLGVIGKASRDGV